MLFSFDFTVRFLDRVEIYLVVIIKYTFIRHKQDGPVTPHCLCSFLDSSIHSYNIFKNINPALH